MRVVTARNSSSDTVSEYCYKLGLEAGGKETVLGYTSMEGYQVRLFSNRVKIHIYPPLSSLSVVIDLFVVSTIFSNLSCLSYLPFLWNLPYLLYLSFLS